MSTVVGASSPIAASSRSAKTRGSPSDWPMKTLKRKPDCAVAWPAARTISSICLGVKASPTCTGTPCSGVDHGIRRGSGQRRIGIVGSADPQRAVTPFLVAGAVARSPQHARPVDEHGEYKEDQHRYPDEDEQCKPEPDALARLDAGLLLSEGGTARERRTGKKGGGRRPHNSRAEQQVGSGPGHEAPR